MHICKSEIPLTPRVAIILSDAYRLSVEMGDQFIGPNHLALTILSGDLGSETELLIKSLGVDLEKVKARTKEICPLLKIREINPTPNQPGA